MSDAIVVSNLGKSYRRYARPWHRLCEWGSGGRLVWHEAFWVLRGITFSVASGESVGIIGLNGAGKGNALVDMHRRGPAQDHSGDLPRIGPHIGEAGSF